LNIKIDKKFYSGLPNNGASVSYNGKNFSFDKSLSLDPNYNLFYQSHNLAIYSKNSYHKEKCYLEKYKHILNNSKENDSLNKNILKNKGFLDYIINIKNKNLNKLFNDSYHKTEIEYKSNIHLFTDNLGITYKPGFIFGFKSSKNNFFADKKFGVSISDLFGNYCFALGYCKKYSCEYSKLFQKEIDIYNSFNPDFVFTNDNTKPTKGLFMSFFERIHKRKDNQRFLGIELNNYGYKLKNVNGTLYYLDTQKDVYDYLLKLKFKRSTPLEFEKTDKETEFMLIVFYNLFSNFY